MASLTIAQGPTDSQSVALGMSQLVIGRGADCDLVLPDPAVSRRHAAIIQEGGRFFLEDLGSVNGTYLNGEPLRQRTKLENGDRIRITGIDLRFDGEEYGSPVLQPADSGETSAVCAEIAAERVLAVLDAGTSCGIERNAEAKLRAIAELSRNLGQSLDLDEILGQVLDSTLQIFPQADWATVVLTENGRRLVPHAVRSRPPERCDLETIHPISRTLAQRVLSEGIAVLSSDVQSDDRFAKSRSVLEFGIRSVMCVPLIGSLPRPMGLLTVDSESLEHPFTESDLDVLVSLGRLCAQSIQFAQLHKTLLAEREQTARVMRKAAIERQHLQEQLLSIAEQEQQRIGRELHDDIGQALTGLALLGENLSNFLRQEKSAHSELAQSLSEQARQTLRKIRAISHGFVPAGVGPDDLRPALAELVQQTNAIHGSSCCFHCAQAVPVADAGVATHLYRIAQEAVTNAVKHSRAEHIDVRLARQRQAVVLTVTDDGIGISAPGERKIGLGLRTMQHRAALIGAELTITAAETGGTTVRCKLQPSAAPTIHE